MKTSNKSVILALLIIAVIFVWRPRGRKPVAATADTAEQAVALVAPSGQERHAFEAWGRNPFAWTDVEQETRETSHLKVFAIVRFGEDNVAIINDLTVGVGDAIAAMTVKRIEESRVIVTDGEEDYVLPLKE